MVTQPDIALLVPRPVFLGVMCSKTGCRVACRRRHRPGPARGVAHAVRGSRLPITLLHADLDEQSFPLRHQIVEDVRALPNARMHVWYERGAHSDLPVDGVHTGVMSLDDMDLPSDAGYYLCGPLPFMPAIRSALLDRGVAPRNIQYEVFGPDLWQADLSGSPSLGAV
jgi:nitric oxide dioxygenase